MATVVIVHGAGSGGWLWRRVRRMLEAAGVEALTPTLTGAGERAHLATPQVDLSTHVADVLGVLTYEDLSEVVLVGHSYGGMVITGTADQAPQPLRRLVYVDAFVPTHGQSVFDLVPPPLRERWVTQAQEVGEGWRLPPLPFGDLGRAEADGVSREEAQRLLARRVPQPIGTYREPVRVTNPDAARLPRTYVACTDKPGGDPFHAYAARFRNDPVWDYREIATGHFPMLTTPRAMTELLIDLTKGA